MAEFKPIEKGRHGLNEGELSGCIQPIVHQAIFETDLDLGGREGLLIINKISPYDLLPQAVTRIEEGSRLSVFCSNDEYNHLTFLAQARLDLSSALEDRNSSSNPIVSPLLGLELMTGVAPSIFNLIELLYYGTHQSEEIFNGKKQELERIFAEYRRKCEASITGLPLTEETYLSFRRIRIKSPVSPRASAQEMENMRLFFGQKIFDLLQKKDREILLSS